MNGRPDSDGKTTPEPAEPASRSPGERRSGTGRGWIWGGVVVLLVMVAWRLQSAALVGDPDPGAVTRSQGKFSDSATSWTPNLQPHANREVARKREVLVRQPSQRPHLRRFRVAAAPGVSSGVDAGTSPPQR